MATPIGKVKVRIRTTFREEIVDDGANFYKKITPDVTIEQIGLTDFNTNAMKKQIVQFLKRNPNAKVEIKGYKI